MKKGYTKYIVLVLFIAFMIFASCSKSNSDLQTTPKNDVKAVLTTSNEDVTTDCSNWTWDQLNEWGENIAQNLTCTEFNERVRTDECFKKWLIEKVKKDVESGIAEVTEVREFHADEHTTGPNCGVVDEGNENCFNGDFEKLNTWVQSIIDRGNEKEIINKMNHNPCVREWMKEMGLLDEYAVQKVIGGSSKTRTYLAGKCISKLCEGAACTVTQWHIDYDDGTYEDGVSVTCNY